MADEFLVRYGAPTLAGIKTGNLFSVKYSHKEKLFKELRELNHVLCPKGIRIIPMQLKAKRALLYLYRPKDLMRDLRDSKARTILQESGYCPENADQCVAHLMERLKKDEGFPHEIGLFLSYPPEDVQGFMENRAAGYKMVGAWKVYGDVEKARRTFDLYDKCTSAFCKMWGSGVPISRLAVGG